MSICVSCGRTKITHRIPSYRIIIRAGGVVCHLPFLEVELANDVIFLSIFALFTLKF